MSFDFDAAVVTPFRMQPGLRRRAPGARQLSPLAPGCRHQREKLAVLSAFWSEALLSQPGFDAEPALRALNVQAAAEHPQHWAWDGERAQSRSVNTSVDGAGRVHQSAPGQFGLGDEVARCLRLLPPHWRLAGLLSLSFAEDFALVNGNDGSIPWLAVALPSHWAPQDKIGLHFSAIHAPVADNAALLAASVALTRLVTTDTRWERFVWNISDHPRLHAHPARVAAERWVGQSVAQACWRTERQSFIAVPGQVQAVFTIEVQVQSLRTALATAAQALAVHDAVASMSPQVLQYRSLSTVREPLLHWLRTRADELQQQAL